ncbi:hypothetical protein DPX16_19010 [Anabarilius grahami]|uniref:Uncharacterized protein n=1 Tax=Anabarilius grahami TaxID=495550 RepID=A0A3N0YLS1_ANAGA|nr:hypothetical protein DPX16_19010 [Anabarilius grahami]
MSRTLHVAEDLGSIAAFIGQGPPKRKEVHAVGELLLLKGIAVLWSSGSAGVEDHEGLPEAMVLDRLSTGGTESSLPCSWDKVGWLPSKRERRSRRRGPEPAAFRCEGEEQGTGDSLPAALSRRSHRRLPGGRGGSSCPPSVQYHRMAPRGRASQLPEDRAAVCPGTGETVLQ